MELFVYTGRLGGEVSLQSLFRVRSVGFRVTGFGRAPTLARVTPRRRGVRYGETRSLSRRPRPAGGAVLGFLVSRCAVRTVASGAQVVSSLLGPRAPCPRPGLETGSQPAFPPWVWHLVVDAGKGGLR